MPVAPALAPTRRDRAHVFQLDLPTELVGALDKVLGPLTGDEVVGALGGEVAQRFRQLWLGPAVADLRQVPAGGEMLAAGRCIQIEVDRLRHHQVLEGIDLVALLCPADRWSAQVVPGLGREALVERLHSGHEAGDDGKWSTPTRRVVPGAGRHAVEWRHRRDY